MKYLSIRSEIGFLVLAIAGVLAFAPALRAQSGYGGQYGGGLNPEPQTQPKLAPNEPPKPLTAQPSNTVAPMNPEEDKAYKAFTDVKPDAVDQEIQAGEGYLQKYPTGRYQELVYARLTNAYFQKREDDKMFAAADKALAINPDEVSVLTLVGWVIPHRFDPIDPQSARRLAKAEGYEKHALEVLATLPKSDSITQEQFAKLKSTLTSQAHSGLGLVYFHRQNYEQSVGEMQKAAEADPTPDPVNSFIMGVGLDKLKRYNEAADAFQKCTQVPGSGLEDRCKKMLDEAKKQAAAQPAAPPAAAPSAAPAPK
jgi:tetratricopeptide (TPR) repeat protein